MKIFVINLLKTGPEYGQETVKTWAALFKENAVRQMEHEARELLKDTNNHLIEKGPDYILITNKYGVRYDYDIKELKTI